MKSMAWMLFAFVSSVALAQTPDGKDAKPSDGAIKGGSMPAPEKRAEQRCDTLSGTLREQCLEQQRKAPAPAPAGATRAPGEPPPQEPRQEKQ
jgi:hypothetical protein